MKNLWTLGTIIKVTRACGSDTRACGSDTRDCGNIAKCIYFFAFEILALEIFALGISVASLSLTQ